MKIRINSEGANVKLYIPNCMFFSKTALKMMQKNDGSEFFKSIDPSAMKKLKKEIRKLKKLHKNLPLVTVEQSGERIVEILL